MGRFLQDKDYAVQTRNEILDLLLDESNEEQAQQKILWAEQMAISQMKKRLAKRYDVATMFAPAPEVGDDPRDPFIITCVIDIVIYRLWVGQAPGKIPEHRSLCYNDVIAWLTEVGTGKGDGGDMPEKALDVYPDTFRIISRRPVNHKY